MKRVPRRDRWSGWLLVLAGAVLVGCESPSVPELSDQGSQTSDPALAITTCVPFEDLLDPAGTAEGEIFGSLYVNGARACEEDLSPFDNRIISLEILSVPAPLTPYNAQLSPSPSFRLMWEFWDVDAAGPCSPRVAEMPHASGGTEAHCVRPGAYRYTGPGRGDVVRQFDVDYTQLVLGSSIADLTPGATHSTVSVAKNDQELDGSSLGFIDLIINTDLGDAVYAETPVLDIDVTFAPHTAAFENQELPSGTSQSWFRFNVLRSTTTWNAVDDGGGHGESRSIPLAPLFSDSG